MAKRPKTSKPVIIWAHGDYRWVAIPRDVFSNHTEWQVAVERQELDSLGNTCWVQTEETSLEMFENLKDYFALKKGISLLE